MSVNTAVQKSSRATRGPFRCQCGVPVGSTVAGVVAGGCIGLNAVGADHGFGNGPAANTGRVSGTASGFFVCGFRRFGIFCRSSHTRSVSSETLTPNWPSDSASSRMEAPVRRSASRTSRYGANWANRWDRGRRPSVISRASACALSVVTGSWSGRGPVMLVGWAGGLRLFYPPLTGGATGAPRAPSKRKRLDVGVLTHAFVLVLLNRLGSFFRLLHRGFICLVDRLVLVFDSSVEWDYLSSWIPKWVRLVFGCLSQDLFSGGVGC